MVGTVEMGSFNCNRSTCEGNKETEHRMVVLPALSSPRMRIRCSLDPKRESNRLEKRVPIRKRDMGYECENGEGFGYGVQMGRVLGMVCKWGGFWVWCVNGEGLGNSRNGGDNGNGKNTGNIDMTQITATTQ